MEHLLGALFAIIRAIHPCNHFNVLNTQNYNLTSGKCPSHTRHTHTLSLILFLYFKRIHFCWSQSPACSHESIVVNVFDAFAQILCCFLEIIRTNLLNHKIIIELLNNRFEISYGHCLVRSLFMCGKLNIWCAQMTADRININEHTNLLMREPIKRMNYWTIDLIKLYAAKLCFMFYWIVWFCHFLCFII